MKKVKRLIIYSVRYPFGLRGGFIKNELPFLSGSFDEIVFLPLNNHEILQTLPDNARVDFLFGHVREKLSFKNCIELLYIN